MAISKIERRNRIKMRIRKRLSGNASVPRLSVFRSNSDIYAQIVDDTKGVTLVATSSRAKELASQKVTKSEKARLVGAAIAKKAVEAGISQVVFDRSGYLYHGRVKALAEGAREGGLKF
ncbi:MAG: 50S ribosomal protein L18 [Bacteroidia bacterium]